MPSVHGYDYKNKTSQNEKFGRPWVWGINYGYFTGQYLYRWCSSRNQLLLDDSKGRKALVYFNAGIFFLYTCFVWWRCFEIIAWKKSDFKVMISTVYIAYICSYAWIYGYCTFKHYGLLQYYWNQYISFAAGMLRRFNPEGSIVSKQTYRILKMQIVFCAVLTALNFVGVIRHPDKNHLLSSLHQNPKAMPIYFRILYAVLHLNFSTFQWSQFLLYTICGCYYVEMPKILKLLK
ncbi:unnamed protein product [Allacma fusca]|uniref:Uncharacterized protein n=1 Tax=Allacma fusca TaxID=39272 RepID=A0A8J2KMH0_9HEXA|nr:unnamed protein product [Allacma fusca]